MGSEWKHDPIADHVSVSQGLAINKGSKHLLEATGLPLLRITDLINNSASQFINADKVPKKCVAQPNELIFTRTGQVGLVFKNRVGVVHNNCFKVIPKNTVDVGFLYWFLFQDTVKDYVNSVASGSVQKDLNHAAFFTLDIPVPPLPEQKAIAHILGSLDDKIELNRRMNATLEGMAQALFKSWFVDFDPVIDNALAAGNPIPDELAPRAEVRKNALANKEESNTQQGSLDHPTLSDPKSHFPDSFQFNAELGWIPEGWEVGCISDLAALNPESWTAKKHPDSVNYVDLANTKDGRINETTAYEFGEAPSRARRVLKQHDTIIGTVRPGNRSFAYIHDDGLTGSTGFAVLRPNEVASRSFIYLGLTRDEVIEVFAHLADGAAYPAIRPEVVGNTQITVPSSQVLQLFEDHAAPLIAKVGEHQREAETLSRLRDTLLPRLISGQLTTKN